ncbi:DUF2780 domain-containing protein [Vibrio sp. SCSIO 43136]|uniref:DUF2780 domain-containing protein n=1 Tax=Vibrio sp. SCSIO 43136 TaxID=2819101 RepID=UPI002074D0C8|nr:DUF2780 domain-containing protein [Vibrio sp. SCSIO 43136]USD65563.1 DUF2780 domain-containing protein [Vibrio sp. SCSIO 43136]
MKKTLTIIALCSFIFSQPSYAFLNLSKDKDTSADSQSLTALAGDVLGQSQSVSDSPLVSLLTDNLGVSSTQAAGGAGALLSLASSQLGSSQQSELTSLIPGMDSLNSSVPGLSSLTSNMDGVNKVFSSLGLDPSLVSQFAPVILQYLTSQGASQGLLGSLTSLWQ